MSVVYIISVGVVCCKGINNWTECQQRNYIDGITVQLSASELSGSRRRRHTIQKLALVSFMHQLLLHPTSALMLATIDPMLFK